MDRYMSPTELKNAFPFLSLKAIGMQTKTYNEEVNECKREWSTSQANLRMKIRAIFATATPEETCDLIDAISTTKHVDMLFMLVRKKFRGFNYE